MIGRSTNLRRIFDAAVEIENPAEREAFVAASCAEDSALQARLEDLLRAHEAAGAFANSPATGSSRSAVASEGIISERIGRYKLLQKLGEGGCGVVYMAEQTQPVKRRVALKVIKLGMDTRSVIARFEAERQALALMDHVNIARVLDAGATETGRPFFVMELVRGVKITDYCDQYQLPMAERLKLFIQVCQGVQHAHQKGIIHRDLKPSNILVTAHDDGTPSPKIIDFGIAKATADVQLTDKTLFTRLEMFIGTPAYMSPEQAEFTAPDVDTRTDIYSLSVLLYELLTGRTPFDSETLLKSGIEAMRRTIREASPPRPSKLLRGLAPADLTEVARRRRSDPPKLLSVVRGDLEWILLKGLEKDRSRRYATANALAADVQRYLASEPVVARSPSQLYSLRKLVARNRLLFAAGGLVLWFLVAGIVASTWQAIRAGKAEARERQLRIVAQANERLAGQAKLEADQLAKANQRQLVLLHVAAGNKLLEERDDFTALLHFVEALRLEVDATKETIHRRRLGSVLRSTPRLSMIWFHDNYVTDARFNPTGTRVVTGSADEQTVRVWDTWTGAAALAPFRFQTSVMGCRYSLDGSRLLTLDVDRNLQLWDAESGALLHTAAQTAVTFLAEMDLSPDGRWIATPADFGCQLLDARTGSATGPKLTMARHARLTRFSPDGHWLAADGSSTGLVLWDLTTSPPASRLLPTQEPLRKIVFSPDSRRIAAYTMQDLLVWDLARGQMLWPSFRPGGDLYECRFSPDGGLIVTASWDGFARLFDTATGRPIGDAMRHRTGVANAVFRPDGSLLATASWDSTARLWNPRSGAAASPALHHGGYVAPVEFSPDGKLLVTAGQDQTTRLWDLTSTESWGRMLRSPAGVKSTSFSADGTRILGCDFEGNIKVWDRKSRREISSMKQAGPIMQGAFSPDGRWVVAADRAGVAQVWDAATGRPVGSPARHSAGLWTVSFSPDGQRFLTAGQDGTARVWDSATGQPASPPLSHRGEVRAAKFGPDGSRVLTGSADGTAQIWDARTGQRLGPPMRHDCEVYAVDFSPDGTRVVTAASDRTQLARAGRIWDANTSLPIGQPLTHIDGVFWCKFSPDGRYVATGSEDKTAAVWDATSGKPLTLPLGHRSYVIQVHFSPDSRMVLSVSSDGVARVWEADTGEAVTPPLVHAGELLSGDWSPDGREVITSSTDGTIRIWDVSPLPETLDVLQRQAELLSAHRLQANLGAVLLSPAEMKDRWDATSK